ncbi:MAG: SAM-dependent methyltransferase [Clostridiaceae bacterium]|jgi:16S rRNA C967 or C1407 C5-methylase (RsmB/RsmF family)|nr:SAM-dependent methyltransferase [Clostridiaceae bacterium]
MRQLPDLFLAEMRALFGQFGRLGQWPEFLQALQEPSTAGLRANRLKITPGLLRRYLAAQSGFAPEDIEPVAWSADGFRLPAGLQAGKLAGHAAGLYYIQEPSAMLPAQVLAARPGVKVLDLCAAPGGKSARIAADLGGEGLLWANEISAERVRALQRNLELTGCTQAVLTSASPEDLARALPGYFDAVLADVPCSGSGMMRRDDHAARSYLSYGPESCSLLQRQILESAWQMLRPGGRLIYSTCSFSLTENEAQIARFLADHPEAAIRAIPKAPGVDDALPLTSQLTGAARIWPHRAAGEGHFCAWLVKAADCAGPARALPELPAEQGCAEDWEAFAAFSREVLSPAGHDRLAAWLENHRRRAENGRLHLVPPCPDFHGLYRLKTGIFLGQVQRKGRSGARFLPSQALLLSLSQLELSHVLAAPEGHSLIRQCLRGETLFVPEDQDVSGWPSGTLAAIALGTGQGIWPLGWARLTQPPILKNLYPAGWVRPGQNV